MSRGFLGLVALVPAVVLTIAAAAIEGVRCR